MNQNSTHGQGINFSGVSNTLSTAQSCLPQVCRLVTLQPNTIYPHSVKPVLHWLELTELPLVTAIRHATSKPSNRGAGSEVSTMVLHHTNRSPAGMCLTCTDPLCAISLCFMVSSQRPSSVKSFNRWWFTTWSETSQEGGKTVISYWDFQMATSIQ